MGLVALNKTMEWNGIVRSQPGEKTALCSIQSIEAVKWDLQSANFRIVVDFSPQADPSIVHTRLVVRN